MEPETASSPVSPASQPSRAQHASANLSDAMSGYAELIDHWHRAGAWTQQWTTIRTLIETLTQLGHDEPAAVLYGALLASPTASPITGSDAERITQALTKLRERLGDVRFQALQTEGAMLDDERATAYALHTVESQLHPVTP